MNLKKKKKKNRLQVKCGNSQQPTLPGLSVGESTITIKIGGAIYTGLKLRKLRMRTTPMHQCMIKEVPENLKTRGVEVFIRPAGMALHMIPI